ncbi:MAG: RimK/LysX family protein [Cyclobacteriaceae bacterium]|nr:RimK/LysX family protein [Cyclobacteriaceae bacterium]
MVSKHLIGRKEKVDFPEFGLAGISAKVDTGAYTSALHCSFIRVVGEKLEFAISHNTDEIRLDRKFTTTNFTSRLIRSSNGKTQQRYVIKTKIKLFGKDYLTEFSLADRSKMKNPVLLGRKLISGRFIVDVSAKYLSTKNIKHKE